MPHDSSLRSSALTDASAGSADAALRRARDEQVCVFLQSLGLVVVAI
jgi:hypothetical protein